MNHRCYYNMNEKIPPSKKKILFMDKNIDKSIITEIADRLKRCDFFSIRQYALYDYDIIILRPSFVEAYYLLRKEVDSAMKSGKIIICFLEPLKKRFYTKKISYTNYDWSEMGTYLQSCLTNNTGETIIPNKASRFHDNFKEIFNSFKFFWKADVQSDIPFLNGDVDILATNSGNFPVSFVLDYKEEYGNGKIIFIPQIMEKDRARLVGFYIALINSSLRILKPSKPKKTLSTPTPSWIEDYKIEGEAELLTTLNKIDLTRREFLEVKKLLYETGTLLVKPVSIVFEKLGYTTDTKEEGLEDIKITFNEFRGLVEVKGLKTSRDIDKTKAGTLVGQLTGHLIIHYPDVNHEDVKLFLVVNYDLDKTPEEKRNFQNLFTDKAITIFESSEVCVLSTLQLFEIYNDIISGEKNEELKSVIRSKIEETNGILELND